MAAALLVLATSLATITPTEAAPSVDPEKLIFGSGDWTFKLMYFGTLGGFGGFGAASGSGGGTLSIEEGAATGTWTFNVSATVEFRGQSDTSNFSFGGPVQGTAAVPKLLATGAGTATMVIYSSSCTQVVGIFSQDAEDIAESVGLSPVFNGKFYAYRTGAAGVEDYEQQAEALITEADALAEQAKQGAVNTAQLDVVVTKAELLAAAIKKAAICNTLENAGDFNLVISQIIADLMAHVADNPGSYTTGQITELLVLGIRVGAIGEGAVDQQFSDSIFTKLETNFESLLDAAIAADNQGEIQKIQILAQAVGWTGLAQKATEAL